MELTKDGILTSEAVGEVLVLRFDRGRIRDERELLRSLQELGRFAESRENMKVLLDMGTVEYLSSAGLGALVGLLKKIRTKNGTLKLCSLCDPIIDLFEVMKLEKIFEIFTGREQALKSFDA